MGEETFDDFLAEQGLLQARENHVAKEIIAERPPLQCNESGLNKTVVPQRMHTNRRQLDRLFDLFVQSGTLDTLRHAPSFALNLF